MNDKEFRKVVKKLRKENLNKKQVIKSRLRKLKSLVLVLLTASFLNAVIIFLMKANLWTVLGSDCVLISILLECKV